MANGKPEKVKSPSERLSILEANFIQFANNVQEVVRGLGARNEEIERTISAAVSLLGTQKVVDEMSRLRVEELEAGSAASQGQVDLAINEGRLAVTPTIENQDDIVVITETAPDGKQRHPARVIMELRTYNQQYQDVLRGNGVGFKHVAEDGTTIEVLDIYRPISIATIEKTEGNA